MSKDKKLPPALNARVGPVRIANTVQVLIIHDWASLSEYIDTLDEFLYPLDKLIRVYSDALAHIPNVPKFFQNMFTGAVHLILIEIDLSSGHITLGVTAGVDARSVAQVAIRTLTDYYEEMKRESRVVTISADEVHGKSREPYKGGIWGK